MRDSVCKNRRAPRRCAPQRHFCGESGFAVVRGVWHVVEATGAAHDHSAEVRHFESSCSDRGGSDTE